MHNFDNTILVITPISHIKNVKNDLEKIGRVTIIDDPSINKIHKIIHKYDVVFTNPNKSKVFFIKFFITGWFYLFKIKIVANSFSGDFKRNNVFFNEELFFDFKKKILSLYE